MEVCKEMDGFTVHIVRKDNKNLYLRVQSDGSVLATAPRRMSEAAIARFVQEKAPWLRRVQQMQAQQVDREIMLTDAHRAYLHRVLPPRIAHWERALGVTVRQWRVRDMKTRWGSCNHTRGSINFALMLALEPLDLIDYVVLHELAHLIEPNHGQGFKAILCKHMPDWNTRRARLKSGGAK